MLARLLLGLLPLCSLTPAFATETSCPIIGKQSLNFCEVAQKSMPAVVYLKIQLVPGSGTDYYSADDPYGVFGDDLFERYFGQRPAPRQPKQAAARGSGFIVSPDGYILTNHHVIKDAKTITVVLINGREFPASVVGADPHTDIGIIKIEGNNLPFLTFADSEEVQIGEWVAAIGSPFELEASLTVGVVSGKGRQNLRITDFDDFIQTDAAINPGNSGGPLLNLDAKVIGVNTAILTRPGMGGYMGIGLAIPSNMAKHVMDQLISKGSVTRGYLGIYMQPLDADLCEALGLNDCDGALVADVGPTSPAAEAGMQQGDVIVAYNDKPVTSIGALRNHIALMAPGTRLAMKIIRNGEAMTITATLGTHPSSVSPSDLLENLGLDLRDLQAKEATRCPSGGVVVQQVQKGSKAYAAGLRPGMVIQQVQRQPVHSVQEIHDQLGNLQDQKSILVVATDGRQSRLFALRLE
ncbi:MAG: Do family serine endopeptidase [Chlamydiia bacterium]